ncbi:MAG: hypothetical protein WCO71_07290, partial [Pseudomonadota bacterium]
LCSRRDWWTVDQKNKQRKKIETRASSQRSGFFFVRESKKYIPQRKRNPHACITRVPRSARSHPRVRRCDFDGDSP